MVSHLDLPPVRITVVQNSARASLGAWTHWPGAELRIVAPFAGDSLPAVDELGDGLVVLGGQFSAHDDESAAWLPELRALLVDAVGAQVPTLGICLGAQLLAVALGGHVQVDAPPGLEAGTTALFWRAGAEADPVLAPAVALADRARSMVVSMHADAIVDLPDHAVWLASSNQYPFQVFRIGSAVGLQFHPEATRESLIEWCADLPDLDLAAVLARFDDHAESIASTSRALAEGFVAAIRG